MDNPTEQVHLPIEQIDAGQPDLFATGKYYAVFERLRKEDPIHYIDSDDLGAYWSVTKYQDVAEIDGLYEIYSADYKHGGAAFYDSSPETNLVPGKSMIMLDPPEHSTYRAMVAPAFAPPKIQNLESEVRARVAAILDKVPVGEEFNWCEIVADELPMQMLSTLFDIPQEDRGKFLQWSNLLISQDEPEFFDPASAQQNFENFTDYCFFLWNKRVESGPGEDLVSMLVYNDKEKLSPDDYIGTMILLVTGGNDTTRSTIAGSIVGLNKFPNQYQLLRDDRSKIVPAIDEFIRWQTPIHCIRRTALQDTELRGKTIKKGDRVILWYASANYDEEVYDQPYDLVIGRGGPKHLSFGKGLHYCLGSRLAELQLRCLWEALLERFPNIELVGEPVKVRSNIVSGYKKVPVVAKA